MNNQILIPPRLRDDAERFCCIMLSVSGADATLESRRRPVVMARVMVANALMMAGHSGISTGIILGIDHSTVHYYKKKMSEILSAPGYDAERQIWKKFNERLKEDYDETGKTESA